MRLLIYILLFPILTPLGATTSQELQDQIADDQQQQLRYRFFTKHQNTTTPQLKKTYPQYLYTLPQHIEQAYIATQNACSSAQQHNTEVYTQYVSHYKHCIHQLLTDRGDDNAIIEYFLSQIPEEANQSTHKHLKRINNAVREYVTYSPNSHDWNSTLSFMQQRALSVFLYINGYTDMCADQTLNNVPDAVKNIRYYLALREHAPSDRIIHSANTMWHAFHTHWNSFADWAQKPSWRTKYKAHENIIAAHLVGFNTFNNICRACENRNIPLGWVLMKGIDTYAWTTNNGQKCKRPHHPTEEQKTEAEGQIRSEAALDMIRERYYKHMMNYLNEIYKKYNFVLKKYVDDDDVSLAATPQNIEYRITQIQEQQRMLEYRHNILTSTLQARQKRLEQYGTTNKKVEDNYLHDTSFACTQQSLRSYKRNSFKNPQGMIFGLRPYFAQQQRPHFNNQHDKFSRSFITRYNFLENHCSQQEHSAYRHAQELDRYVTRDSSHNIFSFSESIADITLTRVEKFPSHTSFQLTELDEL